MLSLGCVTQDWRVLRGGQPVPVVLGFSDPEAYRGNPHYIGAIAGRVANRISGSGFDLGGQRWRLEANEPPNHLHGGPAGLSHRNWQMEPDGARAVRMRVTSEHGEGGYPGRLDVEVTVTLSGAQLCYEMVARSDRPTPVNLAQHSYYSLGAPSVRDLRLTVPAAHVTPCGPAMLPTGEIRPVQGTPLDFRAGRRIDLADPHGQGIDLNYVLSGDEPVTLRGNGMRLELRGDQPCLQLYTGHKLSPGAAPSGGQVHTPFAGLCLEPQGYPDAVNRPEFPSPLATPEEPYRQRLTVTIAPEAVG